ncbi:MAG TPA: MBL fold metallo-hydrolase [Dehalococcoidales bacterium]
MKIRVLGAHNTESKNTKCLCLLVDRIFALDAGGLTSSLAFRQQVKIQAVFLTHAHYDHIRDIPAFAMNLYLHRKSVDIYTHQAARDNLVKYFLNGELYPEFQNRPADNPTLRIHILEPYQKVNLSGYEIMAVPVNHKLPGVGYQIISPERKTIFYTGDTGGGLIEPWKKIFPQTLFIELTALNRWEESMQHNGHLTSKLLKQELVNFRDLKGYLPDIVTIHMNPADESRIKSELKTVSGSLGVSIRMANEGMQIQV